MRGIKFAVNTFSAHSEQFSRFPSFHKENPSGLGGDGWGYDFNNISREEYDVI